MPMPLSLSRALPRPASILLALAAALLAGGCPDETPPGEVSSADYPPTAEIPEGNKYADYAQLSLGMDSVGISQAYNAPDGQGEGFTRVIQDFGENHNHLINFDRGEGEPERRMVVRVYRDEIVRIIDRRDEMSNAQADAWLAELKRTYGEDCEEVIPLVQWSWGSAEGVMLTFSRDREDDGNESAFVEVIHKPGYEASLAYARAWDALHGGEPQQ
jgi:hypothetical protein